MIINTCTCITQIKVVANRFIYNGKIHRFDSHCKKQQQKIQQKPRGRLCRHWRHRVLSLGQPMVMPVKTKLVMWQLSVFIGHCVNWAPIFIRTWPHILLIGGYFHDTSHLKSRDWLSVGHVYKGRGVVGLYVFQMDYNMRGWPDSLTNACFVV